MNLRHVLVSFIAIFALLAIVPVHAISIVNDANATESNFQVSIKGIDVNEGAVVNVFAGETIPLKVVFKAENDTSDVRVKAWISGHRSDVTASTDRFDVIGGSWYSNLLSLQLPTDVDPVEDLVLVVRIEDRENSVEKEFHLKIQRESFNVEFLSLDLPATVTAGDNLNVDIVAKNRGSRSLEDLFVTVRVPALNIEKKVYFSDLSPVDSNTNDNKQDAALRSFSLAVPQNAKPGVYTLEASAVTSDVSQTTTRQFVVLESQSGTNVLASTASKDASVGQEVSFDLILVNQGSRNVVYQITPESVSGLTVNIDEPIVSVPGDSSKVVKIRAIPNKEGAYTFGVNVNSGNELVKRASYTVNAQGQALNNSIVVLTVVLAIIFVVLLVVLIVLLTRKPSREVEESYY